MHLFIICLPWGESGLRTFSVSVASGKALSAWWTRGMYWSDEDLGLAVGQAPCTPESCKEGLPSHLRDEEIKTQRSGVIGPRHPPYDRDANLVSQIWLSPAFPGRACRAQPTSLQPQVSCLLSICPTVATAAGATFQETVATPRCHGSRTLQFIFLNFLPLFALCL